MALQTLSNLACNAASKEAITAAGAVSPLVVALLVAPLTPHAIIENAVATLCNLTCGDAANKVAIATAGGPRHPTCDRHFVCRVALPLFEFYKM